MAHFLKLLVRDSQLDARFLIIEDASLYDPEIPVSNHALFVQSPGFNQACELLFPIGDSASYSARNLGLSTVMTDLTDGLYTITFSVSPNDKVNTTVYHYRTALIEKELYCGMADLLTNQDAYETDANGENKLTKKEEIYAKALLYLKGIQGNIRNDQDIVAANRQYRAIQRLLKQAAEV